MSQNEVRRKDKEMDSAAAEALLARARLGHFATVDPDGCPYVVPNLFVYEDQRILTHNAIASGHFQRNVMQSPRCCFEAAEIGEVFPYGRFECDTSVSYESVVGFGVIEIEKRTSAKAAFFDRFMEKYGAADAWDRPKSFYPRLGEVTVYVLNLDSVTGKRGPLPGMAERWPAQDLTKTPNAKPSGSV